MDLTKYDLEITKILNFIEEKKQKVVLLQFPDGLKPHATEIVEKIKEATKQEVEFRIWLGSCFGACDIPNSDCDLLIQFGHAPWD